MPVNLFYASYKLVANLIFPSALFLITLLQISQRFLQADSDAGLSGGERAEHRRRMAGTREAGHGQPGWAAAPCDDRQQEEVRDGTRERGAHRMLQPVYPKVSPTTRKYLDYNFY